MADYKKVLVAIDGSDESEIIVKRALQMAAINHAELEVALVFEPLLGAYSYELNMSDFDKVQKEHQAQVAESVRTALAAHSIAADRIHFLRGKPATEIKKLAAASGTDLLIIGSHGHNPIRAVLGSTANAVLHGINCDVLTIRV